MFHRCYECPAPQGEREMRVSQELRQAVGSSLDTQNSSRIEFLPVTNSADGEEHIFTDGSSLGSGALRRGLGGRGRRLGKGTSSQRPAERCPSTCCPSKLPATARTTVVLQMTNEKREKEGERKRDRKKEKETKRERKRERKREEGREKKKEPKVRRTRKRKREKNIKKERDSGERKR